MEAIDIIVESGVAVETKSILWKIDNFDIIAKQEETMKSQSAWMEFQAGDKIGCTSTWEVFLHNSTEEKEWIGIYYRLDKKPAVTNRDFYVQVEVNRKNEQGQTKWRKVSTIRNLTTMPAGDKGGNGWHKMIDTTAMGELKRLEIQITLTLYSQPKSNCRDASSTVENMMEEFHVKSTTKARQDLGSLAGNPVEGDAIIKILSNDGQEFSVPKGILAVRSPVFERLLGSNMTEAITGVIQLPDLSGSTLRILVNFIYTGELAPDWRQSSVVAELTYAASKYEFGELLTFLDLTLGRICDLDSVAPLFALASKLSLKTAEAELLKFVREKGTASPQNFEQIMQVISANNSVGVSVMDSLPI